MKHFLTNEGHCRTAVHQATKRGSTYGMSFHDRRASLCLNSIDLIFLVLLLFVSLLLVADLLYMPEFVAVPAAGPGRRFLNGSDGASSRRELKMGWRREQRR